ncbi:MAG: MucB/RseB C-terminal domain-containing protein [Chromatiales bacterium]|nr:MucB/RseB C-terminal domain-containing protein [Chromatiales bacterium]
MMPINPPRLLTLLLLPLSFTVTAGEDATHWLERMSQAVHQLNYDGTFVYMHGSELETMRLIHAVDGSGERERLVSLSGPSREVIREHGQVTCYLPQKTALVANHPEVPPGFPLNLPTHWAQLGEVYELKLQGESRIAGKQARHVAIVPRDGLRYGQNYWIDSESGLLLRTDIVDEQGKVVEQLEFTSLEVMTKVAPQMLQPEAGSQAVQVTPAEPAAMTVSQTLHWQVAELPAGFELELQRQHAMNDNGVAVEHLIFSDGLSSVSVFIEPRLGSDESGGSSQRGSVNAYTHLLPEQRVTVLGEVPLVTVKQIALSIAPLTQ